MFHFNKKQIIRFHVNHLSDHASICLYTKCKDKVLAPKVKGFDKIPNKFIWDENSSKLFQEILTKEFMSKEF